MRTEIALQFAIFVVLSSSLTDTAETQLATESQFVAATFVASSWQKLRHIAINDKSGTVYVGGVNRLYQLDENLILVEKIKTGRVNDSKICFYPVDCNDDDDDDVKLTDNFSKVLLVDHQNKQLIFCGSVHEGSCQIRDLRNISKSLMNVTKPIAANFETTSTVAFIAPGPLNYSKNGVMYIAVTFPHTPSPKRFSVPAVASLSLKPDRYFEIAVNTQPHSTSIFTGLGARKIYPIAYIYGFSSAKFSFFVTRQGKSLRSPSVIISKLVRICQHDSDYASYTEVALECRDSEGDLYNLVLAAHAAKAGKKLASELGVEAGEDVLFATFASDSKNGSVLCVYDLKTVNSVFLSNILHCAQGFGNRGLDYFDPKLNNHKCIPHPDPAEAVCGVPGNTPLAGRSPVAGVARFSHPTNLTAIAVLPSQNFTVVFLGTATGHLLQTMNGESIYRTVDINEGSPVIQDMILDERRSHLYVAAANKVSKVMISNCSLYEDCQECSGSQDPLCGWCLLEGRCSLTSECKSSLQDPNLWIQSLLDRCPRVARVTPSQLPVGEEVKAYLLVPFLPPLNRSLECLLAKNSATLASSKALQSGSAVFCYFADVSSIPQVNYTLQLDLVIALREGPMVATTNFTLFNCSSYSCCTACIGNEYNCTWFVKTSQCIKEIGTPIDFTHHHLNESLGPELTTAVSAPGCCPYFRSSISSEIAISYNTERSISFELHNINSYIARQHFTCIYHKNTNVTVPGSLDENILTCDDVDFSTFANYEIPSFSQPTERLHVDLMWGTRHWFDNPDGVHILLYQCQFLASTCVDCHVLPAHYQCGWCQYTKSCQQAENCGTSWLNRNATCQDVRVSYFYPSSGPWEGGTTIQIEGVNLGKDPRDLEITVAGRECSTHDSNATSFCSADTDCVDNATYFSAKYVPGRKIRCNISRKADHSFATGPVVLVVNGKYRAQSIGNFSFVDPMIKGISPTKGPVSGGTSVTIRGAHLDAGMQVKVLMENYLTSIIRVTNSTISCINEASSKVGRRPVFVIFDGNNRLYRSFKFVPDPVISAVFTSPKEDIFFKEPRSTVSGGVPVTVEGTNLDAVQRPQMSIIYNGKQFKSDCKLQNASIMHCYTPAVNVSPNRINPSSGLNLDYGFIMDGVSKTQNLSTTGNNKFPPIKLFPDPSFRNYSRNYVYEYALGNSFILDGSNLNSALQGSDYKVFIGAESCNVTTLSKTQLVCRPPPTQPTGLEDSLPRVIVMAGKNLKFELMPVKYYIIGDTFIIAIVVGACLSMLLLLLLIGIIIHFIKVFMDQQYLRDLVDVLSVGVGMMDQDNPAAMPFL